MRFPQGGLLITTRQGRVYTGIVEDLIRGLHQGQDCVTGELRVETHTTRSTLFPGVPQRHCQRPLQTRGQSHAGNCATPSLHERVSRCTSMLAHFDRDAGQAHNRARLDVARSRPRTGVRVPSLTPQLRGCVSPAPSGFYPDGCKRQRNLMRTCAEQKRVGAEFACAPGWSRVQPPVLHRRRGITHLISMDSWHPNHQGHKNSRSPSHCGLASGVCRRECPGACADVGASVAQGNVGDIRRPLR